MHAALLQGFSALHPSAAPVKHKVGQALEDLFKEVTVMEFLTNEFSYKSASGLCDIFAQSAAPADFGVVKGVVQIAHGMAEYSNRYAQFALELCKHGYAVYINDHLGHGASVASEEELGYFGDNGPESLVEDMKQLTDIARQEYPNVPVFLFGHSMGSFLARKYTAKYGHLLDGVIYSGTSGSNPAVGMGIALSNYMIKSEGKLQRSSFLDSIAFGTYNKKTAKKTKFDWLSRDEKEVEKYINDKRCGFVFTVSGFKTLFSVLKEVSAKVWYNTVPADLQILLIAGDKDPVGDYGKGVTEVYKLLRKTGHTNVTMNLYPEARHELLNELNRQEVIADVVGWLDMHLPAPQEVSIAPEETAPPAEPPLEAPLEAATTPDADATTAEQDAAPTPAAE